MQKSFILSSLLISTLLADNHLGESMSSSSLQKKIEQTKAALKKNQQMINEATFQTNNRERLKTRLTPKRVKNSFRKDHHRYDNLILTMIEMHITTMMGTIMDIMILLDIFIIIFSLL